MPYELRYIPGSPLGAKFPLWRFGQRTTRESADATRMQCATPDQIEVVEVPNGPRNKGKSVKIGAENKAARSGASTPCASGLTDQTRLGA